MKHMELLADVMEAIELMNRYRPVYLEVLKRTGDKKQAIDAIKYIARMEAAAELVAG